MASRKTPPLMVMKYIYLVFFGVIVNLLVLLLISPLAVGAIVFFAPFWVWVLKKIDTKGG